MSAVYLGGTFDPPHIGHLVAAEYARIQFGTERAVFLPAGDPYRKTRALLPGRADDPPSPAEFRLEMLRMAIADNASFDVDEREIRRDGPSYTVDTLRELAGEGVRRPVFIFGPDAIADMPNWREPAEIQRLAVIAIAPKPGTTLDPSSIPAGAVYVEMPPLDVSSTDIRRRVRAGLPIRYIVPSAVESFIRERRLYLPD